MVCLLLDLGRLDRALDLFLNPSVTPLTFGSYALALLALLGAAAAAVRFFYLPFASRSAVAAIEVMAVVVAVAVMLYTGLLLQSIGGIAFWNSPFIPALFVLSSASSGVAIVLAASFFVEPDEWVAHVVRIIIRADIVLIVLEAVCVAAFILTMAASTHSGVQESLAALIRGDMAPVWWLGFCLCGMAVPLVIETAGPRAQPGVQAAVAAVAVLVLIGAFCLRLSIVEAGVHREPVLEPAAVVLFEDTEGSTDKNEGVARDESGLS